MAKLSIEDEVRDILHAKELIKLGARMNVLTAETSLSREKLIKLYKEIRGESPSKGMLPFSEEWYLNLRSNTEASLYVNLYQHCLYQGNQTHPEALLTAYKLLQEHLEIANLESCFTITRAWTLLRLIKGNVLGTTRCSSCKGVFVTHAYTLEDEFTCCHCKAPPPRALAFSSRKVAA